MYNNGGQEGFVEVVENSFTYSATDLVGFLECQHLTSLDRAALSGHLERPERTDPVLDRIAQGNLTFDPIMVDVTQNMFDEDAFHVFVVYDGDSPLLDPAKLNRISSLMTDRAAELGIENTILESCVESDEHAGDVDRVEEPLDEISGNQDWHGMLNIARRFLNTEGLPSDAELNLGGDRSYFAICRALCHNNAPHPGRETPATATRRLVPGLHGHGREHYRGTAPPLPAPSLRRGE